MGLYGLGSIGLQGFGFSGSPFYQTLTWHPKAQTSKPSLNSMTYLFAGGTTYPEAQTVSGPLMGILAIAILEERQGMYESGFTYAPGQDSSQFFRTPP